MNDTAAALSKARTDIIRMRRSIVENTMKLAAEIEKLEQQIPVEDVQEFLTARCGLSAPDIKLYGKISKRLGGYTGVLTKWAASYEMIKALSSARENIRGLALANIASGRRFDLADLRVLRRQVAERQMPTRAFIASSRRRAMKTIATRYAEEALSPFESGASDLIEKIAALSAPGVDAASPARALPAIAEKAKALVPQFEAAFGSSHPRRDQPEWRTLKPMAREAASIHQTLRNLAKVTEGSQQAVSDRAAKLATGSTGPLNMLARFTGNVDFMSMMLPDPKKTLTSLPAKRLRVLELCAGAGGMALGLEAAGFEHVALVEFDKGAAATMRRNRPHWPVIQKDLTTIDFTQYAGKVDLVCGGLPCQAFSEEGKGKGKDDKRDLLLEGARAVREIQPRAFLFENVRGSLFGKHSDQIARFLKELNEAGYDVQIVDINTQDYGVAQNRPRILFVGLRTSDRRNFEMPRKFPKRRAHVGDVLYDLMAANGWSDVDDWAEYCRTVTFELDDGTVVEGAQAFTLLGRKGKAREFEALRWARGSGLDPSGLPNEAPTDELARRKGPNFIPGLTLRMRARLQDFPDRYEFVGGKSSVAQQIGNAVAPRMAQAVGLALYAALEHVKFDMEAILWPEDLPKDRVSVEAPSLEPSFDAQEVENV
ncbi:DNA cytosine methyltransferase [Rhizobium leguminosarum]|uniref:DNA cytosine methyltransferase n=1 Tax=Rhizobium leguminosarum TaxID=384 RepID=UPI001032319E|nr:DNA cytosine methyltransferase [Rhizobium leguminosarum]TAV81569.1 DNA cytosine methyltransferase [Rhizobium leguminosarum]TAV94175.1 DNA cytosine methyltransferase [Rhizobium leguminosarum]TAW35250.1 DNA cytosine methyltransferase [Rhizobium leguminosarum]